MDNKELMKLFKDIFKHIKQAKLLKKLAVLDFIEMYKFTIKTICTPENLRAISEGIAKGMKS